MSIRLQATIPASRREVYGYLADTEALSALSGMGGKAGLAEGEQFSAFDGRITGRHVELAPGTRVVQAWRFPEWAPGVYSVVRLELDADPADDTRTRIVLEQHGYPDGADALGCHENWHDHLTEGWGMFYFGALARHFESQLASAAAAAADEIKSLAALRRPGR
jgi:uncharacterized protein YndB with AHSA1/START domain